MKRKNKFVILEFEWILKITINLIYYELKNLAIHKSQSQSVRSHTLKVTGKKRCRYSCLSCQSGNYKWIFSIKNCMK